LLEITDNFEKAFEVGEKTAVENKMLEGFQMIYRNLIKIFEEYQVREIAINENTKFDVELHEAIMAADSKLPEGTIMHVAQKGYMYGDKVLRHAKVVTSKGENE
jgi:molecular chaperone GrpE